MKSVFAAATREFPTCLRAFAAASAIFPIH